MAGRPRDAEQRGVGKEGNVAEAGDRWHCRTNSGGDDEPVRGDAPAIHHDRFFGYKAGLAGQHRCTQRPIACRRVVWRNGLDRARNVGANSVPIDLGWSGTPDPEARGAPRTRRRAGSRKQRLAGHAARVQAISSHPVAFDKQNGKPELGGNRGDRKPGCAGADHRQVELSHARPASGPQCVARGSAAATISRARATGRSRAGRR